jgi:hypothetical protein
VRLPSSAGGCKAITVKSAQGPEVTIIDGAGLGRVVTFMSRETRASVLSGFTIRGGFDTHSGAGIQVGSSTRSPSPAPTRRATR